MGVHAILSALVFGRHRRLEYLSDAKLTEKLFNEIWDGARGDRIGEWPRRQAPLAVAERLLIAWK